VKTVLQIPATFELKTVIRVWTAYSHQLRFQLVDTENFYSDIDLPQGGDPNDHESIIKAILAWKRPDVTPMAYQVMVRSYIEDDRSAWGHQTGTFATATGTGFVSARDISFLTKKIFFSAQEGTGIVSLEQLRRDVRWVNGQRKKAANDRDENGFRVRHVSVYTSILYRRMMKEKLIRKDSQILKMGAAAYVVLTDDIEFRPHTAFGGAL